MPAIDGKLISITSGVSVEHYSVRADLFVALTVEPDDAGGQATVVQAPVSGSARAAADGTFHIPFEVEGTLQGPVQVIVAAPNGIVVDRRTLSLDDIAHAIELRIHATPPFTVDESDVPGLGERLRINGRVIDVTGLKVPPKLPVVIWGVDQAAGDAPPPRPLLVTETQIDGAFGGAWPDDVLAEAFGRVSGGAPIPVPLDPDGRLVRDILLVTRVSPTEACDCTEAPPRAPDPVDLTSNPEAFSQDLGGGCVDLTVPNRTLEEYPYYFVVRTSEPSIKGVTLGRRRKLPPDLLTDLLGVSLSSIALRGARLNSATLGKAELQLDIDSARRLVRTDAVPRPEDIERAAWLSEVADTKVLIDTALREDSARQVLDADTPIDWDETPTVYLATEIAFGHILQYREVWRADGYSLGDLLYSLPLAPGQRRQIAVVDWERRTRTAREEALEYEETLDALIERDRDVREIVGTDLHEQTEGGSRNTTWGAAGGIGAGFISSGFGIFGGVAGGASGSDTHAWQNSARQLSADSLQQLRDRIGQRSSSVRSQRSTVIQTVAQGESVRAETEVVANYNRCHAITVEYFEVLRHFLVTHELADVQECLFVPLPIAPFDRGKALRWREYLSRYLKDRTLLSGFDAIERVADDWVGWDYPVARYSEEAPNVLEGELYVSFVLPRPRDADDGSFQLAEWEAYRDVLPGFSRHVFSNFIEKAVAANKSAIAARDEAFQRDVAPQIATNVINRLRFAYVGSDGGETEVPLDGTLVSRYREDLPLYITLSPAGELPQIPPREDIAYFKIWYDGEPLPPDAKVIIHRGRMRYRTDHITALLFDDDRIFDDVGSGDPALVATPVSRAELRNPREEDRQLADRVVAHLNDSLEFYHQAIWVSLDAQRRYMLLDAIEVPGQQGRSVASVCVNDLIGIVGNSLVLPAAPGQRLNPSVSATDAAGKPVDIRNAYAIPPAPRMRLSVPTRGVYAEAVAGECSACEAIDETRYWRWSVEGLLAPPEIQGPIDTGTRASEEPALTPTPLPAPLVSIQNAPAVPDPFGLKGAFDLLAKPDLFRDITGLEGTQKNAGAAFDAALSAASAMGGEAAKLARQAELTKNSERVVDRIGKAVDAELLTPEAARRLTTSLLEGLTGKEEPAAGTPLEDPAVNKAVQGLSQSEGGNLKVESGAETVEVSFDDAAPVVGAGNAVPRTLIPPAPHDSTDVPVLIEASFTGRADPNNSSADDLTPFVFDTRDGIDFLMRRQAPNSADPLAELTRVGMLLPGRDADHYRLRRSLQIVYPADPQSNQVAGSGPLPIVVLQHGAHEWVRNNPLRIIESYKGLRYLQDHLASLGIVSVSVDANAANVFNATLIAMRADLVVSALDSLRELNKTSILRDRLDFSRIGLVGHSRGGEAVVRAARTISADRPEYAVKFVCSVSPTDFSGTAKQDQRMALEAKECPFYAVLYGTQDNDVSGVGGANAMGGTGFRLYDRARTSKVMVFLEGCNHNRFNAAWMADEGDEFGLHPDDAGDIQSEATHQALLKEYVGALARWKLLDQNDAKDLFDGQQVNQKGVNVSLQWSFGEDVIAIDDMEDPVKPRTLQNASVDVFAEVPIGDPAAGGHTLELETNHQTSVLVIDPNIAAPVPAALSLDLPPSQRDWRAYPQLLLRATALFDLSDAMTILQGRTPEFDVQVRDGSNNTVTLEQSFAKILIPSRPAFHRGYPVVATIKSTTPDGANTIVETGADHGLAAGDSIKIAMDAASPLDGVHTVASVLPPSGAGKPSTRFRVAVATTAAGGRGRVGKLENLSVHRLETVAYATRPLDVVMGNATLNRDDIRKLEITPKANFPQLMFIDSIELVKG